MKLENTCAVSLLKHVQYLQDIAGADCTLHYIRTRDGREIDFALTEDAKLSQIIEVKLSENQPTAALVYFLGKFPTVPAFQLVHNLKRETHESGISLVSASRWLAQLSA